LFGKRKWQLSKTIGNGLHLAARVIDNKSSKYTHSIVYTGLIFPNVIRKACLIPWCVNENCSDWELLEIVFNILNEETKGMAKGEYIPLLITFFQEIANGRKLCLPLRVFLVLFVSSTIWRPASSPLTTR
jgi:hypothetical protein